MYTVYSTTTTYKKTVNNVYSGFKTCITYYVLERCILLISTNYFIVAR